MVSELITFSKQDLSDRASSVGHDRLGGGNAIIMIQISKTDQFHKGRMLVMGPCFEASLCQVSALLKYLVAGGSRGLGVPSSGWWAINKV